MKNHKHTSCIIPALLITLSVLICSSAKTRASEPMSCSMPPKWCADMVKMHEGFLKMLKAQDTELTAQVEKMKNAPVDQKEAQVEATLMLLIQQQSAQHSEMEKMIGDMKEIMAKNKCSMMKEMD